MKARTFSLSLLAAALASSAALADVRITGAAEAAYSRAEASGESANAFGGSGALLMTFNNPGTSVQLTAGGSRASDSGISSDSWMTGVDAFWRDAKGAVGVSVAHGAASIDGASDQLTGYGLYGEWYANRWLTLRFNGGGFSGDVDGWYGSGGLEAYIHRNAAVYVEYDYIKPSHLVSKLNDANVGAEFLFSDTVPLSLRFGFSHTWTTGADGNGLSFALRYRFGHSGSLVTLDRNGPMTWNGLPSLMRAW